MKVADGLMVELDYELLDAAGAVVETSADEGPLVYLHGLEEIPPALEQRLADAQPGTHLEVTLESEEAFGEYDVEGVVSVPRADLPAGEEIEVGEWISLLVTLDEDDEDDEKDGERGEGGAGERGADAARSRPDEDPDDPDDPEGGTHELQMRVIELSEEAVVLDGNHPLAGQRVTYRVRVRDVRPATADELAERE